MGVTDDNRAKLRLAMADLLGSGDQTSKKRLTWKMVFEKARVARSTANHPNYRDIKQAWDEDLAKSLSKSEAAAKSLDQQRQRKGRAKEDPAALRRTISVLANHIQVLALQLEATQADLIKANARLAEERSKLPAMKKMISA